MTYLEQTLGIYSPLMVQAAASVVLRETRHLIRVVSRLHQQVSSNNGGHTQKE